MVGGGWPMGDRGGERRGVRGRSCPLAYRYRPEALAQPSQLAADTLYVVGGLYGNLAALRAVLQRAEREPGGPAAIVFNGDFHWLDVDPEDFRSISETVLAHHASTGNVEAELAADQDTGCGCGYPDHGPASKSPLPGMATGPLLNTRRLTPAKPLPSATRG